MSSDIFVICGKVPHFKYHCSFMSLSADLICISLMSSLIHGPIEQLPCTYCFVIYMNIASWFHVQVVFEVSPFSLSSFCLHSDHIVLQTTVTIHVHFWGKEQHEQILFQNTTPLQCTSITFIFTLCFLFDCTLTVITCILPEVWGRTWEHGRSGQNWLREPGHAHPFATQSPHPAHEPNLLHIIPSFPLILLWSSSCISWEGSLYFETDWTDYDEWMLQKKRYVKVPPLLFFSHFLNSPVTSETMDGET